LEQIPSLIRSSDNFEVNKKIRLIRPTAVYNIGKSASIGAKYIQKLNQELGS